MILLYKGLAATLAFKGMTHFQESLGDGKDMFDVYLQSVPFKLNSMAVAFGEVFFLECYLRRIDHCKCQKTRAVFEKLGLLYAAWNVIEKAGEIRTDDLLTSDQLNQLKERIMSLCSALVPEVMPLTTLPDFYDYNIFGHEDFYEKFLGVLV